MLLVLYFLEHRKKKNSAAALRPVQMQGVQCRRLPAAVRQCASIGVSQTAAVVPSDAEWLPRSGPCAGPRVLTCLGDDHVTLPAPEDRPCHINTKYCRACRPHAPTHSTRQPIAPASQSCSCACSPPTWAGVGATRGLADGTADASDARGAHTARAGYKLKYGYFYAA